MVYKILSSFHISYFSRAKLKFNESMEYDYTLNLYFL